MEPRGELEPPTALETAQITSVTRGWEPQDTHKTKAAPVVSTDHNVTLSNIAREKTALVPVSQKTVKKPPSPMFSLLSRNGQINHLFEIKSEVAAKIMDLSQTEITTSDPLLVGSISSNGWLIIWNLATRRAVTQHDSGVKNCSWATILFQNDQFTTFIYSRTQGLFKFTGFSVDFSAGEKVHAKFTGFTPHPGFCHPDMFLSPPMMIVYPCVGEKETDNYCKILLTNFKEEATLPPLEPVMIVVAVELSNGLRSVLVGSESGGLFLFDVQSTRLVGNTNIHEFSSSKCQDEVPFSSDFDSNTSTVLLGTSHRHLYVFTLPSLALAKQVEITNPGTTCVNIRKDGRLAATGGTDKFVRIFTYPSLKPLAVLSFHTDALCTVSFITSRLGYYLLSSSQDSVVAVWDIYSKQ